MDATGLEPEKVNLQPQTYNGPNGTFAFLVDDTTGATVFISTDNEGVPVKWEVATPSSFWCAFGKYLGPMMNGDEWRYNRHLVQEYFSDGILGLLGQVRPGPDIDERRPQNAAEYLSMSRQNRMAFVFNYVVEPGKFPKGVNSGNVDEWLSTRLAEISSVVSQNKPPLPVFIQFNEATRDGNGWNPDPNPLKDKYGEDWLGEYLHQALLIPINSGLVPNKDFVILINENKMTSNASQQFVHDKWTKARIYAYQKLTSDPVTAAKLQDVGITAAEDVDVVLGSQTYVNLDNRAANGIVFIDDPTVQQLQDLANYFADLGGVLLTEVSPHGDKEQQKEFLTKITEAVLNNSNLRGALLWNVFNNPEDKTDKYMQSPVLLFNVDGSPTSLYFALMSYN